ncbi:MAG: hypothetical protein AB1941_03915 [Gemmatimonadota bacterium]
MIVEVGRGTVLALVLAASAACDAPSRAATGAPPAHQAERAEPAPGTLSGRPFGERHRAADVHVDRYGHLHLLVQEFGAVGPAGRPGASRIHYVRWDGRGWSAPVEVAAVPPSPVVPRVAADADGRVLVVWQGSVGPTADPEAATHLLYRAGRGGGWSPSAALHRLPPGGGAGDADLALVSDGGGVVHLVHGGGAGWLHRVWRGGRWSPPAEAAGPGHYPSLAAAPGSGGVSFAYVGSEVSPDRPRARSDVFVRAPGAGRWGPPREVYRDPREYSHAPQVAFDSAGGLHAVWLEGRGGELLPRRILHARSADGVQWSAPAEVLAGPDVLAAPRLVADGRHRLHLVFTRLGRPDAAGPTFHRLTWAGGAWSAVAELFRAEGVREVVPFRGRGGAPGAVLQDGSGGYRVVELPG